MLLRASTTDYMLITDHLDRIIIGRIMQRHSSFIFITGSSNSLHSQTTSVLVISSRDAAHKLISKRKHTLFQR